VHDLIAAPDAAIAEDAGVVIDVDDGAAEIDRAKPTVRGPWA
jgi:hypothetical protein